MTGYVQSQALHMTFTKLLKVYNNDHTAIPNLPGQSSLLASKGELLVLTHCVGVEFIGTGQVSTMHWVAHSV